MSPESRYSEYQPESFYYELPKDSLREAGAELIRQGFVKTIFEDPEIGVSCAEYTNDQGRAVLIFPTLESPEILAVEVDAEIAASVEKLIPDIKYDTKLNNSLREFSQMESADNEVLRDVFDVWDRVSQEKVDQLKKHLEEEYPDFTHMTSKENDKFPEDLEVYRDNLERFISINRMVNSDSPDKYRVKATADMEPVVSDFLGLPNSPQFSY